MNVGNAGDTLDRALKAELFTSAAPGWARGKNTEIRLSKRGDTERG
jgi:hypothetical protein